MVSLIFQITKKSVYLHNINPINRSVVNKLITILFLLFFFASSAKAQSQDNQQQVQALVQKVDSLAHELSYLKLTYEINTLNSDLISFKNEVYTTALEVQINLYTRNYNRSLGRAYRDNYKSCENRRKSFDELIKAKKKMFALMIYTQEYTTNEINVLISSYELIGDILDSLDSSMSLLKNMTDTYIDMM